MTTPSELVQAQRLHPASLLFSLGSAARRLIVPGLVILLYSRGSNAEVWFMVLFFPAAAAALIKYWTYRYRLGPDEMIVREGIVTRNERHIPYARIQNINLVQNPLHRMLRVSEVHLETASGDKPEAVIRVLSLQAIERLREHVFRDRLPAGFPDTRQYGSSPRSATADAGSPPVVRLDLGEIVLFGLISNKGMAVVAAMFGLAWQFELGIEEQLQRLPGFWSRLSGDLPVSGPPATAALLLLLVPVGLVSLKLFSVVWAVLKFHGFTLRRLGDDLRTEYGLLTRITATIPRHRVQLLSTRNRPVHRWCARTTVLVQTAGGGDGDEGSAVDRRWLAPLLPRERLQAVLGQVFPEIELDAVVWLPLSDRARRRRFRLAVILLLIATAGAVAGVGPWGLLLPVVGAPLAWVHTGLWVRYTRYALTPTAVLYRNGWWVRRLTVVRYTKIQAVSLHESPFDRRHGMASLQVDTAGAGRTGQRIDIAYLDVAVAESLTARLFAEAGRTKFRW